MKRVAVIGSGFSGLSAAACLGKQGFNVTVFEKNSTPGGRARQFNAAGYRFDMGPSWYWMPDVIEDTFRLFGKTTSNFYQLTRLDPSYRIYYAQNDWMDVPAGIEPLCKLFEQLEPGSSEPLLRFLEESKYKYEAAMHGLVYKPGLSMTELFNRKSILALTKLHVFQSVSSYIRKYFRHPRLIQLLEFPILFLGAAPANTPALYTLMNYADMALGTWYPQGGMYQVVQAMTKLCQEAHVRFQFDSEVTQINVHDHIATGLTVNHSTHQTDYVVATADYHHVEQQLLEAHWRRYNESYWQKRKLAPSCLIFYVGLNRKVARLQHHNLFFDADYLGHLKEIYESPSWPSDPLMYVAVPSKTDPGVAPTGHENLFVLMPVASGLADDPTLRQHYFDRIIERIEQMTGNSIRDHVVFQRSYAHNDFEQDYHAFRGNAYGLANTIGQTAHGKPSMVSKKVRNLFYAGQFTVPGPGVPPALIAGQVVAGLVTKAAGK